MSSEVIVEIAQHIDEIPAEAWDACARGADPFTTHAFLSALESSGSAVGEEGWTPHHLVVRPGENEEVVAVAPVYMKTHSYGEYVFDWSWAGAYQRAGGAYYPKLQCCVPFSPVSGSRLLVRPGTEVESIQGALVKAMLACARRYDLSSVHITFSTEQELALCDKLGLMPRLGLQFHWQNDDYQHFDEFLAQLTARKRKLIKKERRQVCEAGVTIECLRGEDIKPHHWDRFYRFYLSTIDKKMAHPYLTESFFRRIGETMSDQIVMMVAREQSEWVASALNLQGNDALYGRYWGCAKAFSFLHFELCYYRAIEHGIENKLTRVEAGAQGPHKLQRGYMPALTYSAHWIGDPAFADAINRFLEHERSAVERDLMVLTERGPYRSKPKTVSP